MNKKAFSFLVAILSVFVFDLFYFDAPPSASQDINGGIASLSLAAVDDYVQDSNFGFGFRSELNSPNSNGASSVPPGQAFDPVTMLLLGSGVIGLAGLGRKKI